MRRFLLATAALALSAASAGAETLNVGLVATLSGQSAVLGQQPKDAFTCHNHR